MPNDFRILGTPELELNPPFEFARPAWYNLRWGPARIKILIVTDGNTYNETDGFSLGIALNDAFDPAHPDHPDYARFEFTKAHRSTYPNDQARENAGVTEDFDGFQFTSGSLDDFDELWLFGVSTAAPYLSSSEVSVIEDFMDDGGGVLAMGDHEDLGLGLCGGIKRVRSMRKWWFDNPAPPANMLRAPDNADLTRNDTVQAPTPGGNVNSGSQSDATPQPVLINYNYAYQFWHRWIFSRVKYPHPILCGPRGAIKVMADHAHEGDCIIPDPAFASEYPGNVPVEVIARGRNVVGRTKFGSNQITEPREFGLFGVWDGHNPDADKGRIVVDATWHHWFNVNLFGLRAENSNEYKDVLAFYRNVAVWLAPKKAQRRMRRAGQLIFMLTADFIETTLTLKELKPHQFYGIGVRARDALGRIAPQCQTAAWYHHFVLEYIPRLIFDRLLDEKFEFDQSPFEVEAFDRIAATIFGGIVNAIAVEMNERQFEKLDGLVDEIDKIAAKVAPKACELAMEEVEKGLSFTGKLIGAKAKKAK